jgi:DnaJ-class molecular chaperone
VANIAAASDINFGDFFKKTAPKQKRDFSQICKVCNGTGQERVTTQSGFGRTTKTIACSAC